MKIKTTIAVFVLAALTCTFNATAQKMNEKTVMVGGAPMYPSKNIIENAVNSNDHKTLVAAVKAAGLVKTLQSKGPFTVFAPTDKAFAKLPKGTIDHVLKPENKAILTQILTYHVLAGNYSAEKVWEAVKANNGKVTMTTVAGAPLTFWTKGKNLYVTDVKGNNAKVTIANVNQSNGVIHVIDTVLMP